MKRLNRYFGLLAVLLLGGLLFASCDSNPVPPVEKDDPGDPDPPGTTIDADKLSEYLVFTDATKITGVLPAASDGQLKISFKDTIYVIKDFPYGARVMVQHNGRHDLTGVYVGVSDGSFYYDVPVVDEAAQNSTDVIWINIDIPVDDAVDYPFTIPVKILPHGSDGTPLDEFTKWVTSEDPEDTGCPITVPKTPSNTIKWVINDDIEPVPLLPIPQWEWDYTVGLDFAGVVFQTDAPALKTISKYQTGGCCNNDGTSSTVGNDPYCFAKFSDGTANPRWRTIDVETYFMWAYDWLWFYDDGTFAQANESIQTIYRPSKSDFCINVAADDSVDRGSFVKFGTHDFALGADYLNIDYDETDPPVFGKIIGSGELIYTCHRMALIVGLEETYHLVFKRFTFPEASTESAWWD